MNAIKALLRYTLAPVALVTLTASVSLNAENLESEILCHHQQHLFAPATSPDHRKYAPSRDVDYLHLKLEITPSFTTKTVAGTTTLTFSPIAQPVSVLALDAVDLEISTVQASTPLADWHMGDDQVILHFATPIAASAEAWVRLQHEAEPKKGMYFRTPDMGYREGEAHIFTQGEAIESRHWFPCFDAPNEKLTTEIICHVPAGMNVLANGRKLGETPNSETGLTAHHWLQDKPHVNYLIALVAGPFEAIRDTYRDIPMAFYTLPSQIEMAKNSFEGTKDMMAFIEAETGVPYPWDRYDQVCVNDFVAGGMENTTLTILTDGTLFDDSTEQLRSSQNLVAHELAHQWFGDLVTCKDWSHLWLNEGFATYFECLYHEHKGGKDAFHYSLLSKLGGWINNPTDATGIVNREYDSPMQQFSFRAYPKGGWVLHMIRSQLGAETFRRIMNVYLERHAYGTVVTEDLNRVIEELTGQNYDQFFDQWVYHGGHPDLEVSYQWDTKTKQAKINVKQKQKPSADVLLFRFPLTVRFKCGEAVHDFEIEIKNVAEDFYFSLPTKPTILRIDPELTLLCRSQLKIPTDMTYAQLADDSDMIGRILAIRQLGKKASAKTIKQLGQSLRGDTFYGVRVEAAKALRALHTPEALKELIASTEQEDSRVRHQVISGISSFYNDDAREQALAVLATETNPLIRSTALSSLSPYDSETVKPLVLASLTSDSFQQRYAQAGIQVINDLADKAYVTPLLEALIQRGNSLPSRVIRAGLDALAKASAKQTDRSLVRDYLLSKTQHPNQRIGTAAIRALGRLGDPAAIPALTKLAAAQDGHPDRAAAQAAIKQIRDQEPPQRQLKHLLETIDSLKNSQEALRQKLDKLEKQWQAQASQTDESNTEDEISDSEVNSDPETHSPHKE